jgi:hypothetical protein
MKKLGFIILSGVVILILIGFFTLRNLSDESIGDESRAVFIKHADKGFRLFRNGNPFMIVGASGDAHLKELARINGNTIRLYDTLNLSSYLEEAQKYNLAVIVDIPIPSFYEYKPNKEADIISKQRITKLIRKFCNHPALLMWNLGNEMYYPFVFRKNSFIENYNELINIIHSEDPNHPVGTTIAGDFNWKEIASIYVHSPKVDIVSFNTFGDVKNLSYKLSKLFLFFGPRPYYISEWGSDGPWNGECDMTSWRSPIEPTSTKRAEQIRKRYEFVSENNKNGLCLGSLIFFWGQKQECTHTWFSLFKEDNSKSEVVHELENLWKGSNDNSGSIGLDYMLLNKEGALDNIVCAPGELKTAEIVFNKFKRDSTTIAWELYPDSWSRTGEDHEPKPLPIKDCFKSYEGNTVSFVAPTNEGPYRIFAYIYDKQGNFATTNTPFYVLSPK